MRSQPVSPFQTVTEMMEVFEDFFEGVPAGARWALVSWYDDDGYQRFEVQVESYPGEVFAWDGVVAEGVVSDPWATAEEVAQVVGQVMGVL